MPNHQGNGNGTGRNVALPEENRPSWRPQDENGRGRRSIPDEEAPRWARGEDDDDRYMRAGAAHWEDLRERRYGGDEDWRNAERYGQGQSGYAAGRYQGDRSMMFRSRSQGYPGSFEDHNRDRPNDDRFAGHGGPPTFERHGGHNLGTGGAMHTGHSAHPHAPSTGYQGWQGDRYGQPSGGVAIAERAPLATGVRTNGFARWCAKR